MSCVYVVHHQRPNDLATELRRHQPSIIALCGKWVDDALYWELIDLLPLIRTPSWDPLIKCYRDESLDEIRELECGTADEDPRFIIV